MSNQESHLKTILDKAVQDHTKRKDQVRLASSVIRIGVMVLGMISTVLLGLNLSTYPEYPSFSRNAAIVCNALMTFLSGLAAFWNIDTYWLKRKVLLTQLQTLKEEFAYLQAQQTPMPKPQLERIFRHYKEILNQQTEYWEGMLTQVTPPEIEKQRMQEEKNET